MALSTTQFVRQPRVLGALAALVCFSLLSTAFYMEYVLYLEPCPLCMAQRVVFALFGLVGLAMAIRPRAIRRYAIIATVIALAGLALATRQLYLQSLPPELVPACAPGLYYMIESFPVLEVLSAMLTGTGDCAEVQWTFLTLSIPGWTALSFAIMAAAAAGLPWYARS
ncbi:MAG: disulfide bond formation protein B [Litorivicinus sp.]